MDPLTLSLILQSVAEGTQKGIGSAIQAGSTIDRLSPEQKTRMKQLERQQALGMLGMDKAQQQQILSQQLQPVQTSLREAMQAQAQQQQIGDIGQGSAFRGQQALLEGASQARTRATQSAQQQIAELDELAKARQLAELQQYKAQQQQNRKAIGQIASGLLAGGATAAAGVASAETAAGQIKLREEAMKSALQKMTKSAVETAQKTPPSNDFNSEAMEALGININQPVNQPVPPSVLDEGEAPIITGDSTAQAQQIVNPELFIDPNAQARQRPEMTAQDILNFIFNQSNQASSAIPALQNVDVTGMGGFIPLMAGVRAGRPTVVGTPVRPREQAEAPAPIPVTALPSPPPQVQPLESPTPVTPVWARSSTVIRDNNGQIIGLKFVTTGGRTIETQPGDLNWNLQEVGLE